MERYDYREAVYNDLKAMFEEGRMFNQWEDDTTPEELVEHLESEAWYRDSVTGNASGSYTFSTWVAEENLAHNWDILEEAADEFGYMGIDMQRGAEHWDVTIRLYLLREAAQTLADELDDEGYFEQFKEADEEE